MKKNVIKMNEGYQNLQTTQVTNPVGYLICSKKILDYIKRKGFNPQFSGDGILGKGLYFIESNLYPNIEAPQFRKYGDSAIKVRANGTFNAYRSSFFGGNVFLVPPEQFDSIEILDMIEPDKIQQQKDDMYANYGNRSIGGGAKDVDDFYDLNMPGSLAMQSMEDVGSLYRDNGQNPRWASPKGDFTTKRISESQLRKMIAESIKNLLSEYWDEDGDWDKAINSNEGVFNVYTNDYSNNAPVFVGVVVGGNEVHYKVPEEMKPMLKDLGTKQGRTAFLNAITNGNVPSCNIDVLNLKGRGYKSRAFNANAF